MPINPEVKSNLISQLKNMEKPEKPQLVGLYKHLTKMYEEDDKYTKKIVNEAFNVHEKLRNLYANANQFLLNQVEVRDEDLIEKDKFFTAEEQESEEYKNAFTINSQQQVEGFWLSLFKKIPKIAFIIKKKDEEVLAYLDHVECFKNNDNADFRIEFTFRENPFFSNDILVINVKMDPEDDQEIESIKSDIIFWKEDKNILVKKIKKKGKKGKVRYQEKRNESFFWVFKNFVAADFDQDSEDEEEMANVKETDDICLFDIAHEFVLTVVDDLMPYFIPAYYDVYVDQFKEDLEHDHSHSHDDDH